MAMLRRLADAGRVVVVVTHSPDATSTCATRCCCLLPAARPPIAGHPAQSAPHWAAPTGRTSSPCRADPDGAYPAFLAREPAGHHRHAHPPVDPRSRPPHTSTGGQISTVARRQVRLILADRGYLIFLVVLPFVLGALALWCRVRRVRHGWPGRSRRAGADRDPA